MNSVHAVLRNWDILQVIINFVKGDFSERSQHRDLVAVALVCRVLSDLALNVLWRDIDMEDLNSLFPMDRFRRLLRRGRAKLDIAQSILWFAPTTPQHWERFDVYSSRVRTLSASPLSGNKFLYGVRKRYHTLHHPFPNLTCLEWESKSSLVADVMLLICPTLTEVLLSIDRDPEEDEHDDALADVLRRLGETCPRLRNFEYTHSRTPNNRSKAVESSLIHLIRQCGPSLEDVRLPVSRDLLRSLGSLPHLSTLRLDYVEWEDGSQLHLPIQVDEWIEEADRFPVLDDLTIQDSHTVSSLTECFHGSGCFPRKSFTMWDMSECDEWSTVAITEFFRGILRPDRSEGLLVFSIDRESDVENPVGHDPWQALRSLSIPNIQTLTLDGFFLDINDTDLKEMSRVWPKLHSLSLDVPYYDDEYQSQISFQGLAHISTLENLETVSLMLAPESTISESMLTPSTSSKSQLIHLTIQGKFPPDVTPHAAAMFLILHFPRLHSIKTSLASDKGEEERMKEIQVLLDARPEMINLRSVPRSLRSGTGVEH